MRIPVPFLVLLVVAGLAGLGAGDARAEKVRTNQATKVFNRPGEQGKVVLKVKEGQAMTVVAKEGRWLKVRVQGRTGFVPRSKVDEADEDDVPRNTRRRAFVDGRSRRRGFGGSAPDDRVGADATGDGARSSDGDEDDDEDDEDDEDEGDDDEDATGGGARASAGAGGGKASGGDDEDDEDEDEDDDDASASGGKGDDDDDEDEADAADDRVRARVTAKTVAFAEPDPDSDAAFTARPGDVLYIESRQDGWAEVSVDDGDIGWIRESALDTGGGAGRRQIVLGARLGVTFVRQQLTSANSMNTIYDNPRVGSSAATMSVAGALLYPVKPRIVAGGEIAYDLAVAVPGIAFDPDRADGPMPSQTTSFKLHNLNVRAMAGYDLRRASGAMVFARLGYHREAFMVANVEDLSKNNARLPSEILSGPTIGAALALPRLTPKLGLDVRLDAMLFGGGVTQTKNLENGSDASATRILGGLGVTYRWKAAFDLRASYDLSYGSVSFGAPAASSMRGQTGTSAERSDLYHMVTFGIGKAL